MYPSEIDAIKLFFIIIDFLESIFLFQHQLVSQHELKYHHLNWKIEVKELKKIRFYKIIHKYGSIIIDISTNCHIYFT